MMKHKCFFVCVFVCRHLTDQLRKIQIVNDTNKVSGNFDLGLIALFLFVFDLCLPFLKDFVVEALRSIAEILTYGDHHDPSFFEHGLIWFEEGETEIGRRRRRSRWRSHSNPFLTATHLGFQVRKSSFLDATRVSCLGFLFTQKFEPKSDQTLIVFLDLTANFRPPRIPGQKIELSRCNTCPISQFDANLSPKATKPLSSSST
ncbi:hypothetical protein YC2023_075812 [Brassica napus]